jgi:hypothetical protein
VWDLNKHLRNGEFGRFRLRHLIRDVRISRRCARNVRVKLVQKPEVAFCFADRNTDSAKKKPAAFVAAAGSNRRGDVLPITLEA